jgi:RND family efflux transporter MFP subunit
MEAKVVVKLGTAVVGLISSVSVDRGDTVKAGQVVATLDSGVQEAVVALARLKATNEFQIGAHRSRREFLSKKLERVRTLRKKDFASVAALDEIISDLKISENSEQEAKLGFEMAKLELERELQALAQRRIRSPVDGVVTERVLFTGEYRNETNHLMTIAQIDPLKIEVILPVAYYGQLKLGSLGEIRPEQPVGGSYRAKVSVIDQVVDAGSGTFGVRLELPNPENILPAGIRCKVKFQ